MPDTTPEQRPGFQGSETSWVEVTFYQHGGDPVAVWAGGGAFPISGPFPDPAAPKMVSVQTSKAMGTPSGQWSVMVKPSKEADILFNQLVDDDWVDIVFYRHDQPWHTMRGLVDDIRRSKTVSGRGATSEVYTITGRDFGKIWEITPVWFSPYANNDLVTEAVANKVFDALPSVVGSPPVAVQAYLKGFLEALSSNAGVNWEPPPGMPGMEAGNFLESVDFHTDLYQDVPSRVAFNPNFMAPQGTLWSLAQQYSDPLFTELYVDLLPKLGPLSGQIAAGDPLSPDDTQMTVVIRDKPFPVSDQVEFESYWDEVPVLTVPRQQILTSDLGRSGMERFNAFFVASLLHQEVMGKDALSILAPLVHLDEIKLHGMRRMDVQSQMAPENLDFGEMASEQRRIIRDWYALNPYLLSGTLNLSLGRPDIKIGCRVRVPGAVSEQDDESFYVEQVGHAWTFGPGTRTNLGVTRGWIGSDDSYLDKMKEVVEGYVVPELIRDSP